MYLLVSFELEIMSIFQSTKPSDNLFAFNNIRIFVNSQLTADHIHLIQLIDPSYNPNTSFLMNRTVIHPESKTCIQLNIHVNLCDIIVPSSPGGNDGFKHIFSDIINFVLTLLTPVGVVVSVINEMGFKINFYIPTETPAANIQWWENTGITKMDLVQYPTLQMRTTLGVPLSAPHRRYTLYIYFWLTI